MTGVPESLIDPITEVLCNRGDSTPLQQARAVGGGCINHVLRVETAQSVYLLKWHPQPPPAMFLTEAQGLALLHATQTIRIPSVLSASDATSEHPAYILTEWIDGPRGGGRYGNQAMLGEQLAQMHRYGVSPHDSPAYGLDHDNYIGTTPQYNGWESDWITFYRERRLRPQLEFAQRTGRMPSSRRHGLERLMERLEQWLSGVERCPALLHGDLWGGNVIAGTQGEPVLLDPAVSYGDREAEIAYTELFGGFGMSFYRAYNDTWPLEPGYDERRDLYNLYHLLNHLNIFGESYGPQVDSVVRCYVG